MPYKKLILLSTLLLLAILLFIGLPTDRSFYVRPERWISFGGTILLGFIFMFLVPARLIDWIGSLRGYVKSHFFWFSGSFLLCLLVSLYAVNQYILRGFMNSADEHSCYFLAECIKMGKWWAVPHPLSEFFEVVHVGNKGGKWFSVYPPGWPLLFSLGLQLNIADWVNPILAVAAVVLLFKVGERIYGFSAACLGTLCMSLTPFFLFNNASYFSHTTCLFMISIFLYAYWKWTETNGMAWAFLTAFAVGYGLSTRYLTMAAVSMPFLLFELGRLPLKKGRWNKSYLMLGLTLLLAVYLNLYYNYFITGNFFEAPNHYYHAWERLGFHSNYTLRDALRFALARCFFLIDWIPPALFVVYIISLFKNRETKTRHLLFRIGFFYLVFAYLFYYSWGGNQYGPRYYFEGLPFLAMSAGEAICTWWDTGNQRLQKFLVGALLFTLFASGYLFFKQGTYYRKVSEERKALYVLAEQTVKRPAIVFIRGFLGDTLVMAEEDAVRNHPDLKESILYAHDLGDRNDSLKRFYPDRSYYLGSYDRAQKKAQLQEIRN